MHVDLAGMTIDQITDLIRAQGFDNEASAIDAFTKFLSLQVGDHIAVNNATHGLFGVGVIGSAYTFEPQKHDTGTDDRDQFYSHYREVK